MMTPVLVPHPLATTEATGDLVNVAGRVARIRYPEEYLDMSLPLNTSEPLPAPKLTAREIQILREWAMRDSKYEVAQILFITSATVSTHINRIRLKYAAIGRPATTKAALIARALQDGHVHLDEL